MCLIECNQPVYPLDIVRTMRDQRAMMIQTPVSTVLHADTCVLNMMILVVSVYLELFNICKELITPNTGVCQILPVS